MFPGLKDKIQESLRSVAPVAVIVLLLGMTLTPLPLDTLVLFLAGTVLLVLGMSLFNAGVDMSMRVFGEAMGAALTRRRSIALLLIVCFVIGFLVTIAEPDLSVLANQVSSIPNSVLLLTISVGVGLFLVFAVLRILLGVPISWLLAGMYALVFILSIFVPNDFVPLAFDSGGVTTGPITVPFILALGVGIAAIRGDRRGVEDTFGLVAICSVGPILTVLLLGLLYNTSGGDYAAFYSAAVSDSAQAAREFALHLPKYAGEVAVTLAPLVGVFVVFNLLARAFRNRHLVRVGAGFVYAFFGLVLFLTGVNIGFMPAGLYIGGALAAVRPSFLIVPIVALIGFFIVRAEPSVQVLNRQVEEITSGAVTQKTMSTTLSIGIAVSAGLAMVRVITGISIYWFLVPGYALAIILSFFVPRLFTGIAFDSGGVASGPMTSTFLLPLAQGACAALGGNILTDAFGLVAMVAMTPLLAIQIFGLVYKRRSARIRMARQLADSIEDEILDYDEEETEKEEEPCVPVP
ncbi:MAG: DUF1538 domain-containing protein [Oscillospiraceae bacterium]|nr:DUF1538 domain-containing protein [Oscillospiraceae bacterium]